MNIADLLSRACTPQQMLNSKRWEGPSWLKENPEFWPVSEIICQPNEVDIERRKGELVNMNLTEDTPLVEEIVLVGDDNTKRLFWALAKIRNHSIGQYLSVHKDSFSNPPTNRRLEEAVVGDWPKRMKFKAL
ncbi:hypothetical protein AVEN_125611-1 [Araneus ventricosus]|uniref:DUF5641 domain-containing protein n=1 Tax=Araneus ventricosus TaxID=182803 RepID=A0A4Y2T4N4_ARAVE|nr:hypothetical protein AVEN_125611-1 [Araneus ventricosus]